MFVKAKFDPDELKSCHDKPVPSSVLLAMQEAALINTSISDHWELSIQKLNIKKSQETTDNTSALEYDRKQHGGKFDSELRGKGQEQDE